MKSKETGKAKGDLRTRAEALIVGQSSNVSADAPPYEEVLHELLVYQTELEMQNEELCKAQEVIEESRTRYVDLYDFAPVAYLTFGEDGRIVEANLTACGLLGAERRNLIGKFFSRFVARDDQDVFHGHRQQVLKTGVKQTCELRLRRPDGRDIYASMESIEAESAQGPTIRSALIDISQRKTMERERDELEQRLRESAAEMKQAYDKLMEETKEREALEAELRQSQKMEALGTLTGGIAHDFNNILAAIIGFSELVAGHATIGSPDERYLRRITEAGIRGRQLVRQLLIYSRKTEQERKPLQLSSLVAETVKLIRAATPTTITIRFDSPRETGLILGDPVQIQQVLMNLCSNAAYAMREKGGSLEIDLSDFSVSPSNGNNHGMKPGPYVRLTVRDTGTGISPDIIHKIFDPFFTTKGLGAGTGLGLSVVHGIVKRSNGYVTVESEPGGGSIFTVYFPRVEGECETDVVGNDALPTGSERILFVDDEELLVEAGEEILTELGYQVTSRKNGREALALFRLDPSRFDLVISDQTMPEMTGVELAKGILATRADMPIIMCTGFSPLVDEDQARAAGIRGFAMKPLTKREIARTIREVLDG